MIFIFVSLFLMIPYAGLMLYYRKSWKEIPRFDRSEIENKNLPFITVIIAARNEEKNIGKCVQSIIDQTYPADKFELIITDDHSTDNTVSVIESFAGANITILHLADFVFGQNINSYKKKSIETALQFAKGELIVTTDGDCVAPPKWLETLTHFYKQKSPVFVALPVKFHLPAAGDSFIRRLFKIFQSLDFMTLQGITGASVFKKVHAMCNGANLAYKKEAFCNVGGFEGIDQLASGDDMLLMQKIQKQYPNKIAFLKSREVTVTTQPADTLKEFMNQRIRWASKTGSYTDKKMIMVLLLVYLLNAWLLILAVSSFFNVAIFYQFIICLLVKTMAELFFLFPVAQFFKNQNQLWWFLPAQPFHILYTVIAGGLGNFGSYQWKGRRVK